jgi:hypothetical protein
LQLAVDLHHACVAALDGAELRVIANLRQGNSATVDEVDQTLSRVDFLRRTVNGGRHNLSTLRECFGWYSLGQRCVKRIGEFLAVCRSGVCECGVTKIAFGAEVPKAETNLVSHMTS